MKNPLISIITSAYQAEKTIKRAALSAISQDFCDWEMIIISDDYQDYCQILRDNQITDERLKFTSTNQFGSGASNARNKGLEIAKGNYIAVLDADDEFKPQKLSRMIPLVEKYGAAVSDIERRDNESYLLIEKFNESSNEQFLSPKHVPWVCLHTCSVYIYDRTKIPNLTYDNNLPVMEDTVFLMSFFNELEFIGFEREPLHIYYKRKGSLSHDKDETFKRSKRNILERMNSGQISVKNDLAKAEIRKLINCAFEIDRIYGKEILDVKTYWAEFFKQRIQDLG